MVIQNDSAFKFVVHFRKRLPNGNLNIGHQATWGHQRPDAVSFVPPLKAVVGHSSFEHRAPGSITESWSDFYSHWSEVLALRNLAKQLKLIISRSLERTLLVQLLKHLNLIWLILELDFIVAFCTFNWNSDKDQLQFYLQIMIFYYCWESHGSWCILKVCVSVYLRSFFRQSSVLLISLFSCFYFLSWTSLLY